MNDLERNFLENKSSKGKSFYKPYSFAAIFNDLFLRFRGKNVVLAEIGIGYGGSLQVWKEYFGPSAVIYGLDFLDRLGYEEEQIKFIPVNQENKDDLREAARVISKCDILIDDGSHLVMDQINTFEEFFPIINPGGIYICEDTHTSYRLLYNGEYKKDGTFIEYCKNLIDTMYHTEDPRIPIHPFCNIIHSISFYNSMIVLRKIGGC